MVGKGERGCLAALVVFGATVACGGMSNTSPTTHEESAGRSAQMAGAPGTGGSIDAGGNGGADAGGTAAGDVAVGGMASGHAGTLGSSAGVSGSATYAGGGGQGGGIIVEPSLLRSGPFKMLAYSKT